MKFIENTVRDAKQTVELVIILLIQSFEAIDIRNQEIFHYVLHT